MGTARRTSARHHARDQLHGTRCGPVRGPHRRGWSGRAVPPPSATAAVGPRDGAGAEARGEGSDRVEKTSPAQKAAKRFKEHPPHRELFLSLNTSVSPQGRVGRRRPVSEGRRQGLNIMNILGNSNGSPGNSWSGRSRSPGGSAPLPPLARPIKSLQASKFTNGSGTAQGVGTAARLTSFRPDRKRCLSRIDVFRPARRGSTVSCGRTRTSVEATPPTGRRPNCRRTPRAGDWHGKCRLAIAGEGQVGLHRRTGRRLGWRLFDKWGTETEARNLPQLVPSDEKGFGVAGRAQGHRTASERKGPFPGRPFSSPPESARRPKNR